MHPAGLVAGGAELRWALLGFSGHCWTRGSHPRAQKCRFCVKTTQNLGKIAHSDTKTSILCSKRPKMGVSDPKSAQKTRFCARNARKRGSRRQKAHKKVLRQISCCQVKQVWKILIQRSRSEARPYILLLIYFILLFRPSISPLLIEYFMAFLMGAMSRWTLFTKLTTSP